MGVSVLVTAYNSSEAFLAWVSKPRLDLWDWANRKRIFEAEVSAVVISNGTSIKKRSVIGNGCPGAWAERERWGKMNGEDYPRLEQMTALFYEAWNKAIQARH